MSWTTKENYYSGQGVVLVGRRGSDGKPTGLRPIGNVPDLKVAIATSVLEHKESTTGQRGTDLRLTTETKCSLNFTLENFLAKNLADSLRGEVSVVPAGTVAGAALKMYLGMVTSLGRIKVSGVALSYGATPLVKYTDDVTPWDYQENLSAGSVRFNDGTEQAFSALGEDITAVTVGATTSLDIALSEAVVGQYIAVQGLTGADAAVLNGKTFVVLSRTSSAVVIAANTTGLTITATGTPVAVASGTALTADFTYGEQVLVDALTEGAGELYMRFEGLNTADVESPNDPVVVEVFRFLTDPLKELSLISDTVQQFVLEGSVLADTSRPVGSRYFNVMKSQ